MPALERGHISRIRQLGWTLLALLQTIERTSAIARLSHVSLGLWPLATTQLSSGAMREDGWVIVLGPGIFVSIGSHFFMILLFKKRTMVLQRTSARRGSSRLRSPDACSLKQPFL